MFKIKGVISLIKREIKETKLLFKLIFKKKKTSKDKLFIREQSKEALRAIIAIPIFMLPGGGVALMFIYYGALKLGMDLSFKKQS